LGTTLIAFVNGLVAATWGKAFSTCAETAKLAQPIHKKIHNERTKGNFKISSPKTVDTESRNVFQSLQDPQHPA
jgi:hypothetical protein